MGLELTPREAAMLSDAVYAGLQSEDLNEFKQLSVGRVPQGFTPTGSLISGTTGISRTSNFAVCLNREANGGDHRVVTIRGTEFTSGNDWMTNGTIGIRPGPNTWPAHAGFCRTYASLIADVRRQIGAAWKIVHVCGHSLGGALANLTALDLHLRGHHVFLYTFGAPRVGPLGFSQDLSRQLEGRVYRVYDRGDPVPMIPLFPFIHAPLWTDGYRVGGDRGVVSADWHNMKTNYVAITKQNNSWRAISKLADDGKLKFGLAYWLERAGEASRIPGASSALWALGKALGYILKAVGSIIQTGASILMTTLDLLAFAVSKAVQLGGQIGSYAMSWIRAALRWLGREVAVTTADVTRAFLTYILTLLGRTLSNNAARAFQMMARYSG